MASLPRENFLYLREQTDKSLRESCNGSHIVCHPAFPDTEYSRNHVIVYIEWYV